MTKAGAVFNKIRLALFPIGYGMIGALVGGTLNRVFIADIGMAASLVGCPHAKRSPGSRPDAWRSSSRPS